jgi:mRNA-degrading endonuclease toxin of MazEF toxin-antitoxin module
VPPAIPPLRIRVQPPKSKIPGFAVIPGIRQIKKSRILRVVGRIPPAEMAAIDVAIGEYLAD